ncbi:hypothetical protein F4804DRAFT_141944 [Jackrogersella minutella]|nr:hypothetical protein F4804DRAFT_141944 [Jackrogersella minutella]
MRALGLLIDVWVFFFFSLVVMLLTSNHTRSVLPTAASAIYALTSYLRVPSLLRFPKLLGRGWIEKKMSKKPFSLCTQGFHLPSHHRTHR